MTDIQNTIVLNDSKTDWHWKSIRHAFTDFKTHRRLRDSNVQAHAVII